MSFSGAGAIELAMFFNHDDFPFLLHLLHILLHLVQDAAVVLLRYTHKLRERENMGVLVSSCVSIKFEIAN